MPKKSVAVQTSPGHFPSPTEVCQSLVRDIKPEHFTKVQISKLEDVFRLRTKPDEIKMQILAMESNLLFKDVEVSVFNVAFTDCQPRSVKIHYEENSS